MKRLAPLTLALSLAYSAAQAGTFSSHDDASLHSATPESLKRPLARSRRYLFHIMNEVERRGMPTEIALLPLVESAFNPTAVSGAKAAGLWQFMPATGRHYGLEQTFWYDGRRDVLGATNAALLAASILSNGHPAIREALVAFRAAQTAKVLAQPDPRVPPAGA